MRLSPEAFELWKQLQVENRRQIEAVRGIDSASETYGSVLAASPAKILKLSMIFEICRWLKDKTRDWQIIEADTLNWRPRTRLAASRQTGGSWTEPLSFNQLLQRRSPPSARGQKNIDAINREADRICQRALPSTTSPTWHGSKPSSRNFAVLRL